MKKGFTLIELLVVIAIIGFLAGALLLAINPAEMMMKGRDAKRLVDMDALSKAILLAQAENKIVLTTVGGNDSGSGTREVNGDGYVTWDLVASLGDVSTYLAALPIDPTNSGVYVYRFASNGPNATFELDAKLEHPDNSTKESLDGGDTLTRYELGTDPGLDLLSGYTP